jgi:hypothetical protein
MINHYHLLVETEDAILSQGMRQLNGIFTQSIDRNHLVGQLFKVGTKLSWLIMLLT